MMYKKTSIIILIVLIGFSGAQIDSTSTTQSTTTTTTTSTTTTTTTTPAPITTTTPNSTTTSSPVPPVSTTTIKPVPKLPTTGHWSIKDTAGHYCIIVQFALQLHFIYQNNDNKTEAILYNLPVNQTSATGTCTNDTSIISIVWDTNIMNITFMKNTTTKDFQMSDMVLQIKSIDSTSFKANQTIDLRYDGVKFTAPLDMSYHCTKPQQFNMTETMNNNNNNTIVSYLSISHVQLEAFGNKNSDQFSTGKDCDAIDTPDIVPIAVGCALAGLVMIVLIAYLIGRRRAQARGYLSM